MTSGMCAVFLAILTVINLYAGKYKILYPPFIYSLVWCLDVLIFWSEPIEIDEVHEITWWVLLIGALAFSVGGWLAGATKNKDVLEVSLLRSRPPASTTGRWVLISICLIGLPFMVREVILASGGAGISAILMEARQAFVAFAEEKGAQSFVVSNLPVYSIAIAVICLIEAADARFVLAAVLSLICCVLTGGRSYVLLLSCALTATFLRLSGKDRLRNGIIFIAIGGFVFLLIFMGLVFLDKDTSGYQEDTGAILTNFVLAYLIVPIPALDYVLMHAADYADAAHHSFVFLYRIFNLLGVLPDQHYSMHDAYVFVPLPTNVYSIYKFYFTDFGFYGMLIAVGLIGFLQSRLYFLANADRRVAILASSILVYPAVMSIFDDLYLGGGFVLLCKSAFVAWIYFYFAERKRNRLIGGLNARN